MFGEAFDFCPAPAGGSKRNKHAHMLPTQKMHIEFTPKEQANKLASQVGVDPVLLDGMPLDLLQISDSSSVRSAMGWAVAAIQHGASRTGDGSIGDFLMGKIAMLPLATRFPLMAEWTNIEGPGSAGPSANRGSSRGDASGFMSFDALPSASSKNLQKAEEESRKKQEAERKKEDAKNKRKAKLLNAFAEEGEAEFEPEAAPVVRQRAEPRKPAPIESRSVLAESRSHHESRSYPVEVRSNPVEKGKTSNWESEERTDVDLVREEEARKRAVRAREDLESTRAAVEAGLAAVKDKLGDSSKGAEEKDRSDRRPDEARGRSRDRGQKRDDRDRDDRRGDRQRGHGHPSSASGGGRRFQERGDSRDNRRGGARRGESRSRSGDQRRGSAASSGGRDKGRLRKNGSSSSSSPAAKKSRPNFGEDPAAAKATAVEPVLRILACRNGWAEYVDQSTGEHVFKNVITGEMSKKKPQEYEPQITNSMNNRRLAWLASHKAQA